MSRTHASFTKLRLFLLLLLFVFIVFCLWTTRELLNMKKSIENGWFDIPTKYYTAPLEFRKGQIISTKESLSLLKKAKLKERGLGQSLGPNQYTLIPYFECEKRLAPRDINKNTRSCIVVQNRNDKTSILEFDTKEILEINKIENKKSFSSNSLSTSPILFAQWSSDGKPALRTKVNLSQIPRYCIDGVLAIEDDRFLNHQGVSVKGILRAALVNLKSGKMSQGGSTLTQQLIKNKYLTAEKSLKRKAKEAIMAVLIELLLDKDEILEAYLNYIYWGQRGPYTVYGIEEASKHYFNKSVSQLGLAECSLLAGAIKGPGIYGPHKPKNSKPRQLKVLNRMRELRLIETSEFDEALNKYVKIYNNSSDRLLAPYYINAIQTWLKNEIKDEEKRKGLTIFTELDFFAQKALETKFDKFLKEKVAGNSRASGFEGSYLLANNNTNSIIALSSGKSNSLNYNSALFAKRHIGSLAKPFVYLNAFLENDESDEMTLTPTTPLNNSSVTYKYEGQTWKPKNYDKKDAQKEYPLFLALSRSKNIPTIELLKMTGHKSLHKRLLEYGFEAPIPLVPSIALGGFEQSPLNVLRAYINLSTGNSFKEKPAFVSSIQNEKGKTIYERDFEDLNFNLKSEERMILEILKKTLIFGTARRSQSINLKGIYSGKTGTTNDHRDAWFASTSPDYTSVTWVGKAKYLTDRKRKITGSSAALPIWMTVTKELENSGRYSSDWPINENLYVEKITVNKDEEIKTKLLFKETSY